MSLRRFRGPLTRQKCADISAIVAAPLLLFLVAAISRASRLPGAEFMLVPPLAVIVFLAFSNPDSRYVRFRSIVVAPVLGASIGVVCYHYFAFTPWGVAIAVFAVLVMQELLGSAMPPAMALAVLAMFIGITSISYIVGVALGTLLVDAAFFVWRKFVWSLLPDAPHAAVGTSISAT